MTRARQQSLERRGGESRCARERLKWLPWVTSASEKVSMMVGGRK